jgi:PAS domain S-box-containing protein
MLLQCTDAHATIQALQEALVETTRRCTALTEELGAKSDALLRSNVNLSAAHDMLFTLFQASPLAIIGLDTEGRVTSWNAAAEALFEWTADEVLGRPAPYVPEDALQEFQELFSQAMSGSTIYGVEVERETKSGAPICLRTFAALRRATSGEVIGLTVLFEDISDRKRVEMAMEASESLWEGYVESSICHLGLTATESCDNGKDKPRS